MTSRILDPFEYERLAGTELETVWPILPADSQVVIVEDEGRIVGCWAVFPLVHVEGLWISPDHRGKGGVARALIRGMQDAAIRMGGRAVNTAATDDRVVELLDRLGAAELPGRHFSLKVGRA